MLVSLHSHQRVINHCNNFSKLCPLSYLCPPLGSLSSVSYTHLDVYKRQEVNMTVTDKLEIEELILNFKGNRNHKACGVDNINTELLKYAPRELHEQLL